MNLFLCTQSVAERTVRLVHPVEQNFISNYIVFLCFVGSRTHSPTVHPVEQDFISTNKQHE